MVDEKLLTVVTSLFNDRDGLESTLAASAELPEPRRRRLVHLIVDGNSRDAPIEVVERYSSQLTIDFRSASDRGIYHAWNRGVRATTTPFLTFLGAGDRFRAEAVPALLEDLEADEDWDILLAKARFLYPSGRIEVHGRPFDRESFGRYFSIVHPGAIYRRTVFSRYGNFAENFRITGDYDFLSRVAPFVRFEFRDRVLVDFPIDGISSASLKPLREAYSVRKRHRTVTPLRNRILYMQAVLAHLRSRWTK